MPVQSPALRGYLTGLQQNAQEQGQGLQQMQGILGLQGALMQQQLMPIKQKLLEAQIAETLAQAAERKRKAGMPLTYPMGRGGLGVGDPTDPSFRVIPPAIVPKPQEPLSPVGKIKRDFATGIISEDEFKEAYKKAITIQAPVQVNMPPSSDLLRGPNNELYRARVGKDGTVELIKLEAPGGGPLEPASKSVDPVKRAIIDALKGSTQSGQLGVVPRPVVAPLQRGKPQHKVGEVVQRSGKSWRVTGFDKQGEPLVVEVTQ